MVVEFRTAAAADVLAIVAWYDGCAPGLGSEFVEELRAVLRGLESLRKRYVGVGRGVRKARMRRFPYYVYFRERERGVRVLAVEHYHRLSRVDRVLEAAPKYRVVGWPVPLRPIPTVACHSWLAAILRER